jgi:hypothetical protein
MTHMTSILLHDCHREWLDEQDDFNLSEQVRLMIESEMEKEE